MKGDRHVKFHPVEIPARLLGIAGSSPVPCSRGMWKHWGVWRGESTLYIANFGRSVADVVAITGWVGGRFFGD